MSAMAERYLLALALALASGTLLAACYGPNAPLGAPCEKEFDCPEGQSCDPETSTCGPPTGFTTWLDDNAEDFGAAGAATGEVEIEQGGFVGPRGYIGGGVRVSGIAQIAIPDRATPWNEIADLPRTGTSFRRTAELNIGTGEVPIGIGLTPEQDDGFTLVIEGEILLETVGRWTFELTTDELGFVDLAPPGDTLFQRLVTVPAGGKLTGYHDVVAPGWHRFRGAINDSTGGITYALKHGPPSQPNPAGISADLLRAPASDLQGSLADGFDYPFLVRPVGSTIDALALGGRVLADRPAGLPLGNVSYSLRFTSQVRIDVGGTYVLQLASKHGHRAWIDGMPVTDAWDMAPDGLTTRTGELSLDPGWHDLVVDLNRTEATPAELDVTVVSGPAWVGQAIPSDHMRPVVRRDIRWAGGTSATTTATNITDTAVGTRTVSFSVPGGMRVNRVDGAFQVTHDVLSSLSISVDTPSTAPRQLIAAGGIMGMGQHYRHYHLLTTTNNGSWTVSATDTNADTIGGSLNFAAITLQGSYGPDPFSKSYSYTSAPREIGKVDSFAYVRWALRQARPTTMVTVLLRTCETAEACDGEPWTPVALGAVPEVAPRRFAQYRVELTGDGTVPTALDWIEIAYRSADR
jgi:hypothetical protein